MKKLSKILVPFLVLSSALISGCKNPDPKPDQIMLSYGDYNFATFGEEGSKISFSEVSNKINVQKESFMLGVKPKHCSCWNDFTAVCNSYIKDHNLICYWIEFDEFEPIATTLGLNLNDTASEFLIFKNGEVAYHLDSLKNHDELEILTKFTAFMDEIIEAPKCMYISEENYDNIIASDKSAVVYFSKTGCPDCQYFDKSILKDYVSLHSEDMKTIYVLDIAKWVGSDEYQGKKDKFGLSEVNNPDFGFKTGFVPYLSYVSNGEFLSGAVVFNDTVSKVDDKYVVTDSYFDEERLPNLHYLDSITGARLNLEGVEVSPDDLIGTKGWNQSAAVKYYKPLIYSFLNFTLPNVTYKI